MCDSANLRILINMNYWDQNVFRGLKFSSGLVKVPLKLGHGWVITSHVKLWLYVLIHPLISVNLLSQLFTFLTSTCLVLLKVKVLSVITWYKTHVDFIHLVTGVINRNGENKYNDTLKQLKQFVVKKSWHLYCVLRFWPCCHGLGHRL